MKKFMRSCEIQSEEAYTIGTDAGSFTAYDLKTPDGMSSDILAVFKESDEDGRVTLELIDFVFGAGMVTDDDIAEFVMECIAKNS